MSSHRVKHRQEEEEVVENPLYALAGEDDDGAGVAGQPHRPHGQQQQPLGGQGEPVRRRHLGEIEPREQLRRNKGERAAENNC